MQQTVKAKAIKLFQEKLEAQDASDESTIWTKMNISTNFLTFFYA